MSVTVGTHLPAAGQGRAEKGQACLGHAGVPQLGRKEGKGKHQLAQYTANALAVTRGLSGKGAEVYPYLQMNGKHCEADWRKQLGRCFKFLFGWKER